MATRQQPGGLTDTFPRILTRTISEDFQPKFERKEEAAAYIISVHLPGFVKERIKITYIDSTRTIRAQGERPHGNNRWSEFNQPYSVPENCDAAKIESKFEQGILTITMPKKIVAQVVTAPEVAKTTQNVPTTLPLPPPPPAPLEKIPSKRPASTYGVENLREEKLPESQINPGAVATAKKVMQKATEDIPPKASTSTAPEYERRRVVESSRPESSASKISKDRKEKRVNSFANQRKRKEGINTEKGFGVKIALDSAKRKVKNLTRRLNEDERQMLVNLGAAVLVLVALGAYVYFSHRSSGRAQD
ncbi:Inactive protein RESTRICTED TEV MOVEMENT 2 [Morella rubra]|uniref:Inactive protein RESTRICTED TEV MOVEMENT 2 n=1 Tax=Morella rubra TaxID=262757 RepID=A0A6A1WJT6_9ROSI|nr:Inactive protein RESTRICTED TEV MOVEMENT 2 [Morella rubra]